MNPKRKPKAHTVEDVQTRLLKALAAEYPSDQTAPGIVTSLLKGGRFYVSVCRYTAAYGAGKVVVAKASAATLLEALDEASRQWLGATATRRDLATLVGGT